MRKSFSDYLLDIETLSNGNEFIRSVLVDSFYKNIPDDVNNKNKNLLSKFYLFLSRKEFWQCGHDGCDVGACYSHEISENVFLKSLADQDSKVIVLDRDISGNVIFYRENKKHKRNASNFPGYCSKHDSDLFSDIENDDQLLTEHFANKQCMRSLHRKRFDLMLQVKIIDKFLSEIADELLEVPEIQEVVDRFKEKKEILLKRLSIILRVYNDVFLGIKSQKYLIRFKELGRAKLGYCFSEVLECTSEGDSEECISFLFKIDFSSGPKAFVCWLDNKTSEEFAGEIAKNYKRHFVDVMYLEKGTLVFSSEFLHQMDGFIKERFCQDGEIYDLTPIENFLLAKEFF